MTKTELELALAEATQTNKKTAGVFLDTLSALAYKTTKKTGEFVLPGFGKLVKQKRKARTGFNPKTQQKIRIPAKTVVKFPSRQGSEGRGSRSKEVVRFLTAAVIELRGSAICVASNSLSSFYRPGSEDEERCCKIERFCIGAMRSLPCLCKTLLLFLVNGNRIWQHLELVNGA